jgi:hypothetical protein
LKEHSPSREHTALKPGHAIAQVIELNLPPAGDFAHPRNFNLVFPAFAHGHVYHLANPTTADLAAFCFLNAIICKIVREEVGASCAWWRALHLPGKVAPGVDAGALTEAVRNLIGVHALESDSYAKPRPAHIVVNQNELALFGFWHIGKQIIVFIDTPAFVAFGLYSAPRMRSHVRHGTTRSASRISLVSIPGEHLGVSHVFIRSSGGMRALMVVLAVIGLSVPCCKPERLAHV